MDCLGLPAAVRNTVYRELLRTDFPIVISSCYRGNRNPLKAEVVGDCDDGRFVPRLRSVLSISLLFVSRQLYQESVGILYDNAFKIAPSVMDRFGLMLWKGPTLAAGHFISQIETHCQYVGIPINTLKHLRDASSIRSIRLVITGFNNFIRFCTRSGNWSVVGFQEAASKVYRTISPLLRPEDATKRSRDKRLLECLSYEVSHSILFNFEGCGELARMRVSPLTAETMPHFRKRILMVYDKTCAKLSALGVH